MSGCQDVTEIVLKYRKLKQFQIKVMELVFFDVSSNYVFVQYDSNMSNYVSRYTSNSNSKHFYNLLN